MNVQLDEPDLDCDLVNKKIGREGMLVVSAASPGLAGLARALADQGFPIISLTAFIASEWPQAPHFKLLVVLAESRTEFDSICDRIAGLDGIGETEVIWMSPQHPNPAVKLNGHCYIESFLPRAVTLDWLQSRRQFWHDKPAPASVPRPEAIRSCAVGAGDPIAVAVLSECPRRLDAVQRVVCGIPGVHVVAACSEDPEQIPDRLAPFAHDIVLLVCADLNASRHVSWLRAIRVQDAKARIILLHESEVVDLAHDVVEFSVSGLLALDAPAAVLEKALRAVHAGELWLPRVLICRIIANFSAPNSSAPVNLSLVPRIVVKAPLTPRELSIVKFAAQGLTNKEMAKELGISPETVKKHLKSIFEKAGVRNRIQLVSLYEDSHPLAKAG